MSSSFETRWGLPFASTLYWDCSDQGYEWHFPGPLTGLICSFQSCWTHSISASHPFRHYSTLDFFKVLSFNVFHAIRGESHLYGWNKVNFVSHLSDSHWDFGLLGPHLSKVSQTLAKTETLWVSSLRSKPLSLHFLHELLISHLTQQVLPSVLLCFSFVVLRSLFFWLISPIQILFLMLIG